jgi:hypothetical protein
MANVTISGKELLNTLISYLEHLEACHDFIEKFAVGGYMIYSLEVAKKKEYQHDFESLTKALEAYETSKRKAAATTQSTVTGLLESIENLKDADTLVHRLAMVLGHYDSKIPREMGQALAYLTDFDDSE